MLPEWKIAKKTNLNISPRTYVVMTKIVPSKVNIESLRTRQFGSHELTVKQPTESFSANNSSCDSRQSFGSRTI